MMSSDDSAAEDHGGRRLAFRADGASTTLTHEYSGSVPGAQAIARVGAILRLITASGEAGLTQADIERHVGLTSATARRLLAALRQDGLTDRDPSTGRWILGLDTYLLGSAAANRYDIAPLAQDILRSLASQTEESAFLSIHLGDETVCIMSEEGTFPLRSSVLSMGVRFPLGVASAGLAIISFLPPQEIEAYFDRHPELSDNWGASHAPSDIRQRINLTRLRGYAVNPGLVVEGDYGLGAAVFSNDRRPRWALSVTGIRTRFGEDRTREMGHLLLHHAHRLTQRIARSSKYEPPRN